MVTISQLVAQKVGRWLCSAVARTYARAGRAKTKTPTNATARVALKAQASKALLGRWWGGRAMPEAMLPRRGLLPELKAESVDRTAAEAPHPWNAAGGLRNYRVDGLTGTRRSRQARPACSRAVRRASAARCLCSSRSAATRCPSERRRGE